MNFETIFRECWPFVAALAVTILSLTWKRLKNSCRSRWRFLSIVGAWLFAGVGGYYIFRLSSKLHILWLHHIVRFVHQNKLHEPIVYVGMILTVLGFVVCLCSPSAETKEKRKAVAMEKQQKAKEATNVLD